MKSIKQYLLNNRLLNYEKILVNAKSSGYQIISLRDWAKGEVNKDKKMLILRHDVDHVSFATRRMLEIEAAHGARASYYFRHCTEDGVLIRDIERYGSEASLHYETIADVLMANGEIDSKLKFKSGDLHRRCLEILKKEIEIFRLKYNIECVTIASHGHPLNTKIGIPNNYLTEDVSTYPLLGIMLEAYKKDFIDLVDEYISDCPVEINRGYRYGVDPLTAIKDGQSTILFLTHPNHWYYGNLHRLRKILKILLIGESQKSQKFVRL